ncbi:DinB family protein [Actinoplanes derwentensis]|uniref:DinB superfamily protein n=1 Tax=Actinoplanes derwentensis TaxID=113562 RepID=A0A1H1WI33_9ACTN|nr:DinB family protein [Actinoplanes derwentensis]GID87415.1 hypothetical protein Ade03nite_63390 [Actinoplanes derwentensis]SDS95839.1 Protein of unknown function [Actinoplanes derwentensis]
MIDDVAKDFLHGRLKAVRETLVWKLDALSEYHIRRPLTATGTNLLGLVKHMATLEAWYFGEIFGRPFPEPLGRWQDADGSDLWVAPDETHEQIIGFYQRAWKHADATIGELPIEAPGQVPWWPQPDVTLFGVMIHVLQETTRHAGHADILREQLDGRTGLRADHEQEFDPVAREAHRAKIELAAQVAAGDSGHAGQKGQRGLLGEGVPDPFQS